MPSTAFADVIYLKNGRKIVGQVTQEDSKQVIYSIQGGELSIPKSMVDHIEKSADPAEEQPPQIRVKPIQRNRGRFRCLRPLPGNPPPGQIRRSSRTGQSMRPISCTWVAN